MNWLSSLINKLFCWLPRIIMIPPDEAGVIVTLGRKVRVVLTGWYILWPIIQECTFMCVTPQVIDLRAQSIITPDGRNVTVSGAIEYEIRDIRKAILNVQDLDRSLQNYALGVIAEAVAIRTGDTEGFVEFSKRVRKTIREHVNDWGIKINHVYITDYVVCRVIRLIGSNPLAEV